MPYFVTIQTEDTDELRCGKTHNEKLNNYLNYGAPTTNELVGKNNYPKLPKKKEVESQALATTMKNHLFVITSTLCCEDEETEGGY